MFDVHAFSIDDPTIFPPAYHATVGTLFSVILQLLISAVGILSFVFIIIGGFKMVSSGGDSKKLDSAKSTILYAIIGLVVSLLALVIVNLVQRFVGTNIVIT